MNRNAVSGILLTLLITGMLTLAINIQPVKAAGTIYIRPDGSIDPPTAPIQRDGDVYTFTDNIYDQIVVERSNIVIDGDRYMLQGAGSGYGIDLRERGSNITIMNMEIKSFERGIWLDLSSNDTISGNNITNNDVAVWSDNSSNNTVSGNNITDNRYGILCTSWSSNSTLCGNSIANNTYGIWLSEASNNIVSGNNITQNNRFGIILDLSSNNTVSGNNVTNNRGEGVRLASSSNNTISTNNIANNSFGIRLSSSNNTLINENNVTANSGSGISLVHSSNSIVFRNYVTANKDDGIFLGKYSNDNSISRNNIKGNHAYGICLHYSSNGNTICGNNIANNDHGVYLYKSSYNSITVNTITNNIQCGIYLAKLFGNSLAANNITDNQYGILLKDSCDNTIVGNKIAKSSETGISLDYISNGNNIYHNNFINNTNQAYVTLGYTNIWDNGYPSGGNYWSDYSGADLHCGPNQDIPGKDGIWDNSYVIDSNNTDNYPLVKPYVPGNLSVSISTDKESYHAGETMYLGLNVTNPDSVKYLCFAVWCELPDNSIYLYMHEHSVILPIGLDYSNPLFDSIVLPNLPPDNYTWHAAFLQRATHTIIVEDTAEWQFS